MKTHGRERPTVRHGWVVAGPVTLGAVLTALGASVGLTAVQWVTGSALGLAVTVLVVRGQAQRVRTLSPADLVTLCRSMLACCVAALVVGTAAGQSATEALVAVTVVALALDLVDGQVARRTRSSSF
jgi:hypothetical protein